MPKIQQALAPYLQIARHISEDIATGRLRPGDSVPSQREIMEVWSVSKATANKVIATLKADGLIETLVGVGSRVAAQPAGTPTGVGPRDMFSRMIRTSRIRLPNERAAGHAAALAGGMDAPALVREALGMTKDSQLMYRSRVIYRDDRPYCVATSWFSYPLLGQVGEGLIARILDLSPIPEGTPQLVARTFGRELTHCRDTAEVGVAHGATAASLQVVEGSPALRVVSTIYSDDWPIESGEYIYPAGARVSYDYDMT